MQLIEQSPEVVAGLICRSVHEDDMVAHVPPPLASPLTLTPQDPEFEEGTASLSKQEDA